MTEQEIKKYIGRLNRGNFSETIFLRPISSTVCVAKVWTAEPKISESSNFPSRSYNFFFIKNSDGEFVGAVVDMSEDLHWFINRRHRKRGHMTKALRTAILPYLLFDKDSQRITISNGLGQENYNNSKNVAISLGFKPSNIDETKFELKRDDFNFDFESTVDLNVELSEDRIVNLRKKVLFASKLILKISDELLMAYNDDQGLNVLSKQVSFFDCKIDDLSWKYGNRDA